ncbi:hypothetical protein KS4_15190 [Poriferisphaera corsica]|uniref:Uncharacterized protein n=1 Tax=Poriferisphaera corsica TaxID=2528020 RepID=A0A517YTD4_9BACT|nr:hypothetical protein KS4_15190 [Poriferisphaera corsica]
MKIEAVVPKLIATVGKKNENEGGGGDNPLDRFWECDETASEDEQAGDPKGHTEPEEVRSDHGEALKNCEWRELPLAVVPLDAVMDGMTDGKTLPKDKRLGKDGRKCDECKQIWKQLFTRGIDERLKGEGGATLGA